MHQLDTHIEALKEAQSKLQILRHLPQQLLRPGGNPGEKFELLKAFTDNICAEPIQEALRVANESEKQDGSGLRQPRREIRKRRRGPSPESPQPYVAPAAEQEQEIEQIDNMDAYIREYNRAHLSRLDIWQPGPESGSSPLIVRYLIRDVVVAYIVLVGTGTVESVSAFGPRERKWPHSQSDFLVYQHLSQQLSRYIHAAENQLSLQKMLRILESYRGLFIDRCINCDRVLSCEGHVPPVVREFQEGVFIALHLTCRQ